MKVVLQRVSYASVEVDNEVVSSIDSGLLLLLGVEESDSIKEAEILSSKICNLRIFEDPSNKLNLSIMNTNGSILLVSNFTLLSNCRKGNRPSFSKALNPKEAKLLYEEFYNLLESKLNGKVKKGVFGADMKVKLLNDGPVTIILDSKELIKNG